jgi:hypothetical protein
MQVSGQLHARVALHPGKELAVPFVKEAGWVLGSILTLNPGRPDRNPSLYRLSYPGSLNRIESLGT